MKTHFVKLLFLICLICLVCALVGCVTPTPSSEDSTSQNSVEKVESFESKESSKLESNPEESSETIDHPYDTASATFSLEYGNGGYRILGFNKNVDRNQTELILPDYIGGIPVTEIADYAFYNYSKIESIRLPYPLKKIGTYAFSGKATELFIPKNVKEISEKAFILYSLKEIIVDSENKNFSSKDGVLYNKNQTTLLLCPAKLTLGKHTIANTCKLVEKNAFLSTNLTELTIPKSVTTFGDDAFFEATLERVIYEGEALDWCNIDFCNTIHYWSHLEEPDYGSYSNPLSAGAELYIGGELLTEVTFPEGTEKIKGAIFYGYKPLTKIEIPDGVTEIGNLAFAFCENLKDLELPNSITYIGIWSFISCYSLKDLTLPEELVKIDERAFANCHGFNKIIIPDKVTTIGTRAFYNCSSVIEIVIGESVKTISSEAFRYCSRTINAISKSPHIVLSKDNRNHGYLHSVAKFLYNANDTVTTNYQIDENGYVTMIDGEENYLMGYVGNNPAVVIPEGVTTIYNLAFARNLDITSVVIPDSVTTIKNGAFTECQNLKTVVLGENVIEICDSAFARCYALEEFVFNQKLEKINQCAFMYAGLISVEIPDSVTEIGLSAFSCTSVQKVKIGSGLKTIVWHAFSYCEYLEEIDLGSVITIEYEAFIGCYSLKELIIPDSVTQMGVNAFEKCQSLERVVFGEGITEIPEETFANCYSLKEIVFGSNVTSIGDKAFYNCTALENVSLTQNVTTLGYSAFAYCTNLKSITLGIKITDLGKNTFYKCENLCEVTYNGTISQWGKIYTVYTSIFDFSQVTEIVCVNGSSKANE